MKRRLGVAVLGLFIGDRLLSMGAGPQGAGGLVNRLTLAVAGFLASVFTMVLALLPNPFPGIGLAVYGLALTVFSMLSILDVNSLRSQATRDYEAWWNRKGIRYRIPRGTFLTASWGGCLMGFALVAAGVSLLFAER